MRPQRVLVVVAALVLAAGGTTVAVRLSRHHPKPQAGPSPTATTTTSAEPTASPKDFGPRDRQYDVVYARDATPAEGQRAVAAAGGVVVHANDKVGVVTVMAAASFLGEARHQAAIYGVVRNRLVDQPPLPQPTPRAPTSAGTRRTNAGTDPLADLQWDMAAIHAPQALRQQKGDPRVLVAVIDTGVDGRHPDLAAAFDKELSRNFVTDYPGADGPCEVPGCVDHVDVDDDGHGTHVAGTIAAARDGFGMSGIAAGVRLVSLRAGQDSGLFLLMPTVDALTYAGDIGVDVANMSYFVDPWLFNCPKGGSGDSADDAYEQRALVEGVRRATDYAFAHGVTLVAAAGNEHQDLDAPRVDTISPDFPDGAARSRAIDRSCLVLPTELPHVIAVGALGRDGVKADYSDYGVTEIQLAAPGGSAFLADGEGPAMTNQTLSTTPAVVVRREHEATSGGQPRTPSVVSYCHAGRCAYYRWLSGSSMASPHVAGVAALVVSRFGVPDPRHPGTLTMSPGRVASILRASAVETPCPSPPTLPYPGRPPGYAATCHGTNTRNGFYGFGRVDALEALRR